MKVKSGDIVTLPTGEKVTVMVGDESKFFCNIYIVRLKNGDRKVIDRETLT